LQKLKNNNMLKKLQLTILLALSIFAKAQEDKKTIAIAPFMGGYDQAILKSVEEVVASSFAKTKRFTIVGRSQMEALQTERNLQKTEDFIDSKYIAQTKSLGAQLLVTGNVTSVTASAEQSRDSQGRVSTSYNSSITVDLKILDVETAQIISSEIITSKADKGLFDMRSLGKTLTGGAPSNEREAYAEALKRFEKEIDKFVSKNFSSAFVIVEIQEMSGNSANTLLISGGSSSGIKKGDRLSVVELVNVEVGGKTMTRKKEIGEIKVSKVEDENFSICDVKSGGPEIYTKFNSKSKIQVITK
jgi:curli biogenesis system outer membrane secretion channel CsgG